MDEDVIMDFYVKIVFLSFFLLLMGCGGGDDKSSHVSVKLPNNTPPVLNLPSKLTVDELTEISIDASASDLDGSIASIQWEQTSGEPLALNDTEQQKLSFKTPKVLIFEEEKELTFKVTVVDDLSAKTEAEVTVKVLPVNTLPIADAGENKTFLTNEIVYLSCNESHDPDGTSVSFMWQQLTGVPVSMVDKDSCTPSFNLPSDPSEFKFILTVEDEDRAVSSDSITITAKGYSGDWNNFNKESLIYRDKYTDYDAYHLSANFEKEIAFISDSHRLRALDISDPYNIKFNGWVSDAHSLQESTILGDLLIANGESTLWFYDITDVSNIKLLSSIGSKAPYKSYDQHNNLIYMAAGELGVQVIDISNSASPSYINSMKVNEIISAANDLKIKDDFLFVATQNSGLKIFDISSPVNSSLVGELICDCTLSQVEIEGNIVALASSENNLLLVDISSPSMPYILSSIKVSTATFNVAIDDNIVAISNFLDGINFLDVTEPTAPKWKGKLPDVWSGKWLTLDNDTLLFVDSHGVKGLQSFDISWLSKPLAQDYFVDNNFKINALVADLETLYLSSTDDKLTIINTKNHEQPEKLSEIVSTSVNELAVNENLLLLGTQSEGLNIVDISDKSNPTFLANFPTNEFITAVATNNNQVYINDGTSTLKLIDLSEPFNPKQTSAISELGWPITDIFLSQNDVLIASKDMLDIVKASETGVLGQVGNYFVRTGDDESWEYSSIVVYKGYAYLLSMYYGLKILDTSNPENISEVAHLANISGVNLKLVGDKLYVVDRDNGVSIYSLRVPTQPRLQSSYLTKDYVTDIAIQGNQIFNMEWTRDTSVYYYNYSVPKNNYSVFDFDKSLNVKGSVSRATINSEVVYDVSWDFDSKVKLDCIVSSGFCLVEPDIANKNAKITWNTPGNQGEYQISILFGNTSFFDSYEDMLILE